MNRTLPGLWLEEMSQGKTSAVKYILCSSYPQPQSDRSVNRYVRCRGVHFTEYSGYLWIEFSFCIHYTDYSFTHSARLMNVPLFLDTFNLMTDSKLKEQTFPTCSFANIHSKQVVCSIVLRKHKTIFLQNLCLAFRWQGQQIWAPEVGPWDFPLQSNDVSLLSKGHLWAVCVELK